MQLSSVFLALATIVSVTQAASLSLDEGASAGALVARQEASSEVQSRVARRQAKRPRKKNTGKACTVGKEKGFCDSLGFCSTFTPPNINGPIAKIAFCEELA
ncbi:hypothetical protein MCOR02_003657 [Pyricularia oryzae]|uniref:Uncharacterized protein n=1 Tax=Pyricularia oryzae TaxID=318829 RepID=A0A4P7MYH1_PYROR|nr:hypothetical protein MCOR01_005479 [Pyricularia oryzae]KAH9434692.1 hypothetical protein MCOR02_003657 [Pyricularia oryzae]KAI6261847.1 hypothetical protein MCOR19_001931 [Pyricularia oryzae]KAI6277757.1 hypothetical protein MCOR26_004959 [Pyricularia oryzae]KAI6310232.1 hypothetical protein MCOR29_008688 [Pyricularia oryzae]